MDIWRLYRPVHRCILCHNDTLSRICSHCRSLLQKINNPCPVCAIPDIPPQALCGQCLSNPPKFDHMCCAFLYQTPLDQLIHGFKERRQLTIGRALAELLLANLKSHYANEQLPDKIAATPLFWRKQWSRGFNQSLYLSRYLSRQLGIEHCNDLRRIRANDEQKTLNRKQRLQNLKHCFAVKRPLNGEHIAVVDDVVTTGATANTIARTLKQAGQVRSLSGPSPVRHFNKKMGTLSILTICVSRMN